MLSFLLKKNFYFIDLLHTDKKKDKDAICNNQCQDLLYKIVKEEEHDYREYILIEFWIVSLHIKELLWIGVDSYKSHYFKKSVSPDITRIKSRYIVWNDNVEHVGVYYCVMHRLSFDSAVRFRYHRFNWHRSTMLGEMKKKVSI